MRKEMIFRIVHVVLLVAIMLEVLGDFWGIGSPGLSHWFLAAFCISVIAVFHDGKTREKMICGIALAAGLVISMFLKKEVSHFGVVLSFGYLLLSYVERTQLQWNKTKNRTMQAYVLWLMPFCVLYLALVFVTPVSDKPYDWKFVKEAYQKLRAIEKELSTYTYTKNPGKLPDSIASQEDFLDYFLLEGQKGYCSYFATAFVLMARAEGIPARYVEWYSGSSYGMFTCIMGGTENVSKTVCPYVR